MKKNKFYAVVVLYNTTVEECLTCKNLRQVKGHDISVVIVDNSTREMNNKLMAENLNYIYMSMGGNVGLSKAYNKVLDRLKDANGIIIWFDDDTNVNQEYFNELDKKIIENKNNDIFCPVIYGQDKKIYSPNEARFFKNKQLKNPTDRIDLKKFNAINSCTAVKLEVYDKYRYDERIFLDQVDHKFFEDQRCLGRGFCKMDSIIHHNFSLKSKKKNAKECWKRYEVMIPDYLVFCSNSKYKLILGSVKVIGWGVRESINYLNPIFIIWCLKYGSVCLYKILKEE